MIKNLVQLYLWRGRTRVDVICAAAVHLQTEKERLVEWLVVAFSHCFLGLFMKLQHIFHYSYCVVAAAVAWTCFWRTLLHGDVVCIAIVQRQVNLQQTETSNAFFLFSHFWTERIAFWSIFMLFFSLGNRFETFGFILNIFSRWCYLYCSNLVCQFIIAHNEITCSESFVFKFESVFFFFISIALRTIKLASLARATIWQSGHVLCFCVWHNEVTKKPRKKQTEIRYWKF